MIMTEPSAEMPVIITPDDLAMFAEIDPAKAQAMIDDATALALKVAPCLTGDLEPADAAAVKAILRAAILRWNDTGSGAASAWQQGAGSFQVSQTLDNRTGRQGLLWPSEISQLQQICKINSAGNAFMINTVPAGRGGDHADICTINFGGEYCSCGAIITQRMPLYENHYGW